VRSRTNPRRSATVACRQDLNSSMLASRGSPGAARPMEVRRLACPRDLGACRSREPRRCSAHEGPPSHLPAGPGCESHGAATRGCPVACVGCLWGIAIARPYEPLRCSPAGARQRYRVRLISHARSSSCWCPLLLEKNSRTRWARRTESRKIEREDWSEFVWGPHRETVRWVE